MKAVVIVEPGGPEVLTLQERPMPVVGAEQVLVQVRFSGINRPDLFQRKGNYPAPKGAPQDIPGLEMAGEVVACGERVTRWKPGDRVCALLAGGGYAEFVAVHAGHCLPLPEEVSDVDGAALPETLFTVWHNVFQRGELKRGQRLLVHGGSGGIGSMAIQLGHLMGAVVFTTAGSDERAKRCEELGAAETLNYKRVDFASEWADQKMDVILDSIGGEYFEKNLSLLKDDGYLVQINATLGRKVELDLLRLMQHRFHLTGSTLRARDDAFKSALRQEIEQRAWPLVSAGQLKPVIHEVLPADRAADAHRMLESGEVFGKLLIQW